jgi:hypothetical protein
MQDRRVKRHSIFGLLLFHYLLIVYLLRFQQSIVYYTPLRRLRSMSTIVDSRPRGTYIPVDCPAYVNPKEQELMEDVNQIKNIWSHQHSSEPSGSGVQRESSPPLSLDLWFEIGRRRSGKRLMADVNNSSTTPNPAHQLPPRHQVMLNHPNRKVEEGV